MNIVCSQWKHEMREASDTPATTNTFGEQINHGDRASTILGALRIPRPPERLLNMVRDSDIWYKSTFRFRERCGTLIAGSLRHLYWAAQGMQIGRGTVLPKLAVTWPHQVSIGKNCRIETGVYFHFDGICLPGPSIVIGNDCFLGSGCEFNISDRITVGDHSLIASGTRFIDHAHGTDSGMLMAQQPGTSAPIRIGRNTWIGANCVILAGVEIGEGAVVAAGAVVTKSVAPDAIVGGVPARLIRHRSHLK
jgi:acetyltransferase-like isoleucine patch superfamily enzyme